LCERSAGPVELRCERPCLARHASRQCRRQTEAGKQRIQIVFGKGICCGQG
jgi:hypothetical protein